MKHTYKYVEVKYDPKQVTVLLDLDDILVDWKGEAAKLYRRMNGLEETGVCDNKTIDWYLAKNLSDLIEDQGAEWWATLPPTPWAEALENLMQELFTEHLIQGVVLCTSPGAYTGAYEGKRRWMEEHGYHPSWQIMTKHKWLCAQKNTVLVDDRHENIDAFIKAGGEYFWWPEKAQWEEDLAEDGADACCPILRGLITRLHNRINEPASMRLT